MKSIEGVIPVMLTPFTDSGDVDYAALKRLVQWYLDHQVDGLFAACQSSEMQYLSLEERVKITRCVVAQVAGRVPVMTSGHISDDLQTQVNELQAMAETGADVLVLVTNHLDPEQQGSDVFYESLHTILASLPESLALGLYECPAPYRRLLSDEELLYCANSGRFVALKDVSCDLATVTHRVNLVAETPLNIINANAAIAYPAMQAGSKGFCGVFTNFHPELYHWLYHQRNEDLSLANELSIFLSLSAVVENLGYPKNAKIYHQLLNNHNFESDYCRVIKDDVIEKYWALDVLLNQIKEGTEFYLNKIKNI
ncbi:dihydrodipicolinate synthase family protein [Celerinatantimonas diazotrophica]|uniref:4-hydroxy-tetrahydrodipicolinate synthase n=1 Tax=Celerinatantimonas diazotrophica TaxID=412034 RepID=A0A4R1K1F0_9GAMM|nr:dihydrodipicolinate synthase family protein [Celerinatantimonas diazotrophica]TCK57782.1 4-hydroxy-tetrahydrodipicolinate synthase [Celerinatantimonas diazotrophica]CAG9298154.1 4-hydroxy-tetrahydrodipicolinate synthase [Celerinatantimonas diazotrophica]